MGRNKRRITISERALSAKYESAIRALANSLWNGRINETEFFIEMMSVISKGLTRAWLHGVSLVGIHAEYVTDAEHKALNTMIANELDHVPSFAQFIMDNSKANGGRWQKVSNRVKLWGKRWIDARNRGRLMAGKDLKFKWTLGKSKDHCLSCKALSGKVKRASQWVAAGIYPQRPPNPKLNCGGWGCDCNLLPTADPMSKGPLPRVPL